MSISFAYNLTYPGPAFPVAEISIAGATGRWVNALSALIDTGADATMIPLDMLVAIDARRIDTRIMRTVDGSRYRVRLFSVAVIIGPYTVHGIDAVANEATPEIILGRDVLNQLVVTLDGLGQTTVIDR